MGSFSEEVPRQAADANLWPEAPDIPGDLSAGAVRAWAKGHALADIRSLGESDCDPWPSSLPMRPLCHADALAILARLRERPCVPRMVWMASYLCAVWERALAAYERALIQDAGDGGIERARAVVREVDDVMRSEPVAAGLGLFSRVYGDLMMRHARLSALAFVRALAGRGPLVVSDADAPTLMAAAQRAYRGAGTGDLEEATE